MSLLNVHSWKLCDALSKADTSRGTTYWRVIVGDSQPQQVPSTHKNAFIDTVVLGIYYAYDGT